MSKIGPFDSAVMLPEIAELRSAILGGEPVARSLVETHTKSLESATRQTISREAALLLIIDAFSKLLGRDDIGITTSLKNRCISLLAEPYGYEAKVFVVCHASLNDIELRPIVDALADVLCHPENDGDPVVRWHWEYLESQRALDQFERVLAAIDRSRERLSI